MHPYSCTLGLYAPKSRAKLCPNLGPKSRANFENPALILKIDGFDGVSGKLTFEYYACTKRVVGCNFFFIC